MKRRHATAVSICTFAIVSLGNAALAGEPLFVCVTADGTLRMAAKEGACRTGERQRKFAEWEPEIGEPPEDKQDDALAAALDRKMQALSQRLSALENASRTPQPQKTEALNVQALAQRIAALENASSSRSAVQRVTAPFEVVGSSGAVILRVAERVSSRDGKGARVTIGAGDGGNYAVRVHRDGGRMVAGVGQSVDGEGLVVVMDSSQHLAANMSGGNRTVSVFKDDTAAASLVAEANGGTVAVYHGAEAVAYLTRSSHGKGGNLTLATSDGFGVFSAGAASDGGGEACLNRVTGGGQQRNVCLGVELPSMGLGK